MKTKRIKNLELLLRGNPFSEGSQASYAFDDMADAVFSGEEECEDCGNAVLECTCDEP